VTPKIWRVFVFVFGVLLLLTGLLVLALGQLQEDTPPQPAPRTTRVVQVHGALCEESRCR
jgi:hypothetical protein